MLTRVGAMGALLTAVGLLAAADPPTKSANDKVKEVAGTAEFLRKVPKHYALLKGVDPVNHRITLLIDGESVAKVWPLAPDAEVKRAGWWARLDQLTIGDRVWCWFRTDRKQQPMAIAMLCDELTEQDMHGPGLALTGRESGTLTVKTAVGKSRSVKVGKAEARRGKEKAALDAFTVNDKIYLQSNADGVRLVVDAAGLEHLREEQRTALRKRWATEGLPGTAAFLHTFSGELDLMLDHEAMRWGRSLKSGDEVTLDVVPPIRAVVKYAVPWRERTQVRLVVNSFEQADLTPGQRLRLKMPAPPEEVERAALPPDVDRPRATKQERVEWFLASIYCTCGIAGDGCTGHFYTLASCNPNGCGMPNSMRKRVAAKIDKGLTDRQVFEELLKELGPELTKPHLLP